MHEATLMAGLMRRVADVAEAAGARRVARVSVRLGALSHLSVAHFADHFERAAAGTLAEGATLDITVSDNMQDVNAQEIVLEGVEVET